MRKLSVGYVVDDGDQPSRVYDLFTKSGAAQHYSIDYLIVQAFDEDRNLVKKVFSFFKRRGFLTFAVAFCFRMVFALERRLFVRDAKLKSAFDTHPLDAFPVPKIRVRPLKSANGSDYRYRDEDLENINRLNIDVILDGQSGTLRGDILNICEFGVVSFSFGDNATRRSGLPGFWEVFNQKPATDFVIQKLSDRSNGADLLITGSTPTKPTYAQNLAQIYKKSDIFTHRFLEDLGKTRNLPRATAKSQYAAPHTPYPTPSLRTVVSYQFKTFMIMTRKLCSRSSSASRPTISGKYDRWGVAYQFAENWQCSVLGKSNIITNPPYRFLADPFVFRRGDLDVCFVEDYDFRTNRGKISVFKINGDKYEELGPALDEPFHMSYPFIFTVDNELYMCPETSEIREIRLYKCIEFPLRWSLHKTLIKDVSAVDTSIFYFEGRWWLLTNVDSSEIGEFCSELHVFYSDAFDSDTWTPHVKNPVIFDSERARNGGFFRDGDKLFRVFQKQGFDQYGESMGIAQITDLGPETYCEEIVSGIDPHFAPKVIGTHSFSYYEGLMAIDFLKVERVKAASR